MPDGYGKDRDNFDNNERGRIFENGANKFYRDTENGYVQQSEIFNFDGSRTRFDKIKTEHGRVSTIEEKSGRIGGKKDRAQLNIVRGLIETGQVHHHVLRTVEGETITKDVRDLIEALQRDFPDRFTHQEISRAAAREIWALGRGLERGQQLELPGVGEKARESRARQREAQQRERTREDRVPQKTRDPQAHVIEPRAPERDTQPPPPDTPAAKPRDTRQRDHLQQIADNLQQGRDLEAAQRALRGAITGRAREIADAHQAGRTLDAEELRRTHTELADRLEAIRAAERAQTRDMLSAIGRTPDQIAVLAPELDRNRDLGRADMVTGLDGIGKEVRQREWAHELDQHNAQAKDLGREHIREQQQRGRDVPAARREAHSLEIDPARVVELDLDKYRAVRDGRHLGWDAQDRVHTYQAPGGPPVRVAHDEERRIGELSKNLGKGLTLEEIRMRELMELSQALPVQEAARTRSIDPPGMDLARADELARERQLERERGTGRERW